MSNLDQLEKLNQLKEKGVLSQEEFDQQKRGILGQTPAKPSKKGGGLWWKIPAGAIGLVLLGLVALPSVGGLPTCDSTNTKAALKDAIENAPATKVVNMRFLDLVEATEVSLNPAKNERVCRGKFLLNGGEQTLTYRVFMTDPNASNFFVEIR